MVLLLLLEFLLDVELGLVDEGLLLQVEIVLGLDADFVGLFMSLLEDEVDLFGRGKGRRAWKEGRWMKVSNQVKMICL